MRDGSTASTYFSIGDKVEVVNDVPHTPPNRSPFSSRGLRGTITDIWDKCEVDPHCCCAELAFDAPITVTFIGSEYYGLNEEDQWKAQFAVEELKVINAKS